MMMMMMACVVVMIVVSVLLLLLLLLRGMRMSEAAVLLFSRMLVLNKRDHDWDAVRYLCS